MYHNSFLQSFLVELADFTFWDARSWLTLAILTSKFNIKYNDGHFDVRPKFDRASPNVKP